MNFNLSPDQRDFFKRKPVIIAATVFVLIIVSAIVLILTLERRSDFCKLTPDRPNVLEAKIVASDDYKAIVRFIGYINYIPVNSNLTQKYLPLRIQAVKDDKNLDSQDVSERVLSIDLECISMRINYNTKDKLITFHHANLIIPPEPDITSDTLECALPSRPFPRIPIGTHYDCNHQVGFGCTKTNGKDLDKWMVMLILDVFEFEVNGDPEKIKQHEFSTPRSMCK